MDSIPTSPLKRGIQEKEKDQVNDEGISGKFSGGVWRKQTAMTYKENVEPLVRIKML